SAAIRAWFSWVIACPSISKKWEECGSSTVDGKSRKLEAGGRARTTATSAGWAASGHARRPRSWRELLVGGVRGVVGGVADDRCGITGQNGPSNRRGQEVGTSHEEAGHTDPGEGRRRCAGGVGSGLVIGATADEVYTLAE